MRCLAWAEPRRGRQPTRGEVAAGRASEAPVGARARLRCEVALPAMGDGRAGCGAAAATAVPDIRARRGSGARSCPLTAAPLGGVGGRGAGSSARGAAIRRRKRAGSIACGALRAQSGGRISGGCRRETSRASRSPWSRGTSSRPSARRGTTLPGRSACANDQAEGVPERAAERGCACVAWRPRPGPGVAWQRPS